jgi:hypothetical protein
MGAAIFFVFMLILFIVGLPIITVSLIFLIRNILKIKSKKQYKKIAFCFTILGTIIGFCLIALPIIFMLFLRSGNSKNEVENIDTGMTITWNTKEDYSGDYFILNDRRYEYLLIDNTQNSERIEIDRAIANIVPENYQEIKWFSSLFGSNGGRETIYSLKNCSDYSILTTGGGSSVYFPLYCDKEYLENKKKYYNNLENYTFYFSLKEFGDEKSCQPIQNTLLNIIEKLYDYKGIETDMDKNKNEYKYISIFGISNDGMMHKYIVTIIIDGNNFYREEYSSDKIHVTILEKEQIAFLLKLIE